MEYEHPVAGPVRQARQAARFSETPQPDVMPAPLLGAQSREVLAGVGLDVDALIAAGVTSEP